MRYDGGKILQRLVHVGAHVREEVIVHVGWVCPERKLVWKERAVVCQINSTADPLFDSESVACGVEAQINAGHAARRVFLSALLLVHVCENQAPEGTLE